MTYTPAAYLTPMVRSSRKMMKQVISMINLNTVRDYQASEANKIRSINVLYSGGLLSKKKYKVTRLALAFKPKEAGSLLRRKRLTLGDNNFQNPSLAPYGQLIHYIKTIDMGPLKDIKDLCNDVGIDDDERIVNGRYMELRNILLYLASMYIKLSRENTVTLCWFGRNEHSFCISLGADVAPFGKKEETCAFLLSFLNLGQRASSCVENFILLGANCSKTHPAMVEYARKLAADVAYIEGRVFQVDNVDVKFYFDLVPSDMK